MPGCPFSTRLTVASLTPACLATSARFRATAQLYETRLQTLARSEQPAGPRSVRPGLEPARFPGAVRDGDLLGRRPGVREAAVVEADHVGAVGVLEADVHL